MEKKAQQTEKEKFKLLEENPINIKKIKIEKRIRKNKEYNASFLEKKRTADEIRTNDNSSKNKHSSESDSQSTQIKKGIKVIYFKSSKYINQSKLEMIFSKYGKIEEIKITKEDQGFIKFSRSEFAQNAMNDKNIIYEKNKLTIDFKKIEIQKDVEIKEEEEEEEEKDKSIKKEKEEDNSKKDKEEDNNENEEKDSENERETSFINTKIQKRNEKSKDKDYSEGFGQKIQTLEDVISTIKSYYKEMEDYKKQNEEYKKQNEEYKKQNEEYKKQNEEYKKKNEKDKKNLFKLIGVLGEINHQNEKYITYLNLKIENLNDKIDPFIQNIIYS